MDYSLPTTFCLALYFAVIVTPEAGQKGILMSILQVERLRLGEDKTCVRDTQLWYAKVRGYVVL